MSFEASASRMGVFVALPTGQNDMVATRQIVERRAIELSQLHSSCTFRPILVVDLQTLESIFGLDAVLVFEYFHRGRRFLWQPQPQILDYHMTFYPHILPNLTQFRGNDMVGDWEIRASLALIRDANLGGNADVLAIFRRLRYQRLATISWRVLPPTPNVRLNAVGEFTDEAVNMLDGRDQVALSIDDI